MKKHFFLLLILILLGSIYAEENGKKPMKAAALSLFVPGGGQFYNEAYLKFGIVSVLEGGLIGLTLYHHFKAEDYYDKFEATADERYYSKYTDYYYKQQNDLWWLGVTVFLSTVDAYVDAHLYNFESEKRKIHLKFDGEMISLVYKF
jgi:uncharacterized protein DUF5683